MKYCLGKGDWKTQRQGEEHCFLLVNGLGGYCSQTVIGSNARHDHGLLIAAAVAPTQRWAMVRQTEEILHVNGNAYVLSSQSFVTKTQNQHGYRYLNRFVLDGTPVWEYMAEGVTVKKQLSMVYGSNSLAIHYEITASQGQDVWLEVIPVYGFHQKNDRPLELGTVTCTSQADMDSCLCMEAQGQKLYVCSSCEPESLEQEEIRWYYYEQDSKDGRDGWGGGIRLHRFSTHVTANQTGTSLTLLYSTDPAWMESVTGVKKTALAVFAQDIFRQERCRQQNIMEQSGLKHPAARQLAVSAQAYLTRRDSTEGMSILAGFPFFGDWGRDTMIAFYGCTLAIGEQETAKSILETFMQYCRRGIMPNLFPEGGQEPLYNTVDASLLFINALWEYVQKYQDLSFAAQALPTVEEIICCYAAGTDYNIHMEPDGLLAAGNGLWQLTWMDVRFGDILPTPRHGKPVEINAYWYNAVMIFREMILLTGQDGGAMSVKNHVDTARDKMHCAAEALSETAKQEENAAEAAGSRKSCRLTAGNRKRCGLTEDWHDMSVQQKYVYLTEMAQKIKQSFLQKFTKPGGTLYDVLPEKDEMPFPEAASQVRCNEVFALAMPFSMIEKEQAKVILAEIRRELYTPVGLRSLSILDSQFRPVYGGSQFERDMAYHQGTVWAYPLGAYYRACLRYADDQKAQAQLVLEELEAVEAAMAEGCLGQLPEIYDGKTPGESKGCYAQAWSAAELLRVYEEAEQLLQSR